MRKRNTLQKKLVLDAVMNLKTHPTAEDVYGHIIKKYPEISRATVYRNLRSLTKAGKIRKIAVPGGADRFDFNSGNHYHIKCRECGCFSDIPLKYMEGLDAQVADMTQYMMECHDIVFTGLCPACAKENK